MSEFFYQIWGVVNFGFRGSEAPKRPILEPTPMRPHSGPFLGPFAGGKILVRREKKIGPLLGPPGARMCHMSIFLTKIFFCAGLFFSRLEQPKRPQKPPGLASVAAAVLWQHSFNCRPGPGTPNATEPTAPPRWCRSVHTARRPTGDRVLCPGVLPRPTRPPTQRCSLLRGLYPACCPNEPAWGTLYLFPSRWFRVNQVTETRAGRVLGGMKGLAPGLGPGLRAGL